MNNIELPDDDVFYHVAGLFGADNEDVQKWVTVGSPRRSEKQAKEELDVWRKDFPHRKWTIVKGHLTWEVME